MKKKVQQRKRTPKIQHQIVTRYLSSLYGESFQKKIPLAVKKIKAIRKRIPFDAIAFTGTSGAGFGFPLSYLLNVPVIHVRKKTNSHFTGPIEGTVSSRRYLIIDDMIESGNTINCIISTIKEELKGKARPVGIFLYDDLFETKYRRLPVWLLNE